RSRRPAEPAASCWRALRVSCVRNCRSGAGGAGHPGLRLAPRGLVAVDLGAVLQRLADIVQSVQQQVLAEWIDIEMDFLTVRTGDDLAGEIDGDARVAAEPGVVHELVADLAR